MMKELIQQYIHGEEEEQPEPRGYVSSAEAPATATAGRMKKIEEKYVAALLLKLNHHTQTSHSTRINWGVWGVLFPGGWLLFPLSEPFQGTCEVSLPLLSCAIFLHWPTPPS